MATLSINVSTHHGSDIEVRPLLSDDCLGFETTVYIKASYEGAEPHIYARDMVYIHGDLAAIHLLLEKCLNAVTERIMTKEAAA